MKAVILAGGFGTRLSEETILKPKPMIEIGGRPILWHIMKLYSYYGINDFIVCCGYKGYVIKEFFANYFLHSSDVTFDLHHNKIEIHQHASESWKVTLIDTGQETMTGGRLKRVADYLVDEDTFCFTYGDGIGNVNISELIAFHRLHGLQATLTASQAPGRFGVLDIDNNQRVTLFREKPKSDASLINIGFFVLSTQTLNLIDDDCTVWESGPLEFLAKNNQLKAFKHEGFWQPMDTLRDKNFLEDLWVSKNAPWKVWK